VENASFLPWLTATAFLHSIMIQERRGMLKVWNVVLIWLTWELTLVGTFLTRSGVVQSVHSFSLSPIGPMFAVFIVLTLVGFGALLVWRLPLLRSENQLDGIASRETAFLTQNVMFLLIMVATLLGTLFAPISEILTGNRIALNAPYFQKVTGPMFVLLLAIMGAAPLLAWRRSAPDTLLRNFSIPVSAAILSVPIMYLLGNRTRAGFIGVAVMMFVFAGIVQEYVRGVRARMKAANEPVGRALVNLVSRNGRRYGGYLVHVGVLLIALAIVGNEFYQSEGQANLKTGESITVANYTLTYRALRSEPGPNYVDYVASMDMTRNGQEAGQIFPKKVVYNKNQDQPMTEVGLRPGVIEDVYVVLAGFDGMGTTASFKVFINPLMTWMWAGGLVLILGVMVSMWPRRRSVPVEVRARVPGGVQPAGGD
jgi:cytochrome c-type biogenesis protein CcmF